MSYIRTDANRNPVGTANILSDSIIVHNYQAVDTIVTNATKTLNNLTQSNLNVTSTIYNENSTTSGLKATNVLMNSLNVNGSGNSMVVNTLNGNNLSLINLNNQDGNISNILNLNMRNLDISSYLYANNFISESITIQDGNGTFNKNINVNGALNANILNNNNLNITQLENSNQITFTEGNVTNNLNAPDVYMQDATIINNQITIQKNVNLEQNASITRLDASDIYIQEKQNSGTISQNNVNNTSLALMGPSSVTFSGSADVTENTSGNNKIVRRNAEIINSVFGSNLDVTALLGTVNGISLLNSNVLNVTDTLYVTSEYNHTTNDINTNGNLIVTTRNFIAPIAVIGNEANVARRIFNSDTISANVVEPSIFYINESARAGNINAGAVTAGSYNALRRITTTGNVESNVLTSNGLRGTGEFIFNSQVDINTLQTVDLNLNNTTISYLSSNSAGANIDLGNLNSYITSNVITGYSTANIIAGNVVQDVVVGNVLANVKVGEIVTGNIYLGNILTEIIVSNTTANLIVGNLSTFITVGNSVSNVVVGNISSNVFIGNLEVIGIVGNVSSNIISGNVTSNIISGYIESNIIVGNIESQVLVGQTTTQVIDGYTIEQIITGNTTANVIVGSYQENVFIGNTVANLVVGNVTANVISGYELANVIIGNVYANVIVGNVYANIVVGNILGNIVIGNIEQTVVVGNTVGNGIVGNVYANIIVGNVESSNVIIGNTVIPNVVIGNITTENVVIGNIITNGVVGNTITTGVTGNIVGTGNANLNIGNLALSSVTIDQISIPNIWGDLTSGNLSGNIVSNKNVGNVILTYSTPTGNIAASSFLPAYNNTQPLTTIAWSPELSLFVAGAQNGNNNRFLTSPDGINWTNRTSTANSNWFGSCWSPELSLFVMVGGGCCATSPDGINWTGRSIPSGEWADICWSKELSRFVAVAWSAASTNLAVMTSSDGVTWTARTTPNNFQWQSVTWSPSLSLFVAVAGGAVNGAGTNTNVMTSPDGITWTLRTTNLQRRWYGVAWSPTLSMFVAVARTGSTSSMMSSTDGINWTSRTSPNMTFNNIIWVSEHSMFIVSTSGASSIAIFSKDGINWNTINNGTGDIGDYYDLAWAPSLGRLCLVNNNATNKVAYATTTVATTITSGNVVETNYFLGNIISSNILIGNIVTENVIIGNVTANVIVSNIVTENVVVGNIITTGITGNISSNVSTNVYDPEGIVDLSLTRVAHTGLNMRSITWSPSLKLLVSVGRTTANATNLAMTSPDGITWTTRTTPNNNTWAHVVWSPSLNLFVACAREAASTTNIMTSPDGITWTARTTPVSDMWGALEWSPSLGIFVAYGHTNNVIVSSNGTSWTRYATTLPTGGTPSDMVWSPELSLFVTSFYGTSINVVHTSSNGTTWTARTLPSSTSWSAVDWSPDLNMFAMVSQNLSSAQLIVLTSPDGINWTSQTVPTQLIATYAIIWSSVFKHFIVAYSYGYMISKDGINWNTYTSTVASNWDLLDVPDLNSAFSIGGNNDVGIYKKLTETFTYTAPPSNVNWRSVCWSSELLQFVAVASSGTTSSIISSTNGTTWTARTAPNTNNLTSVCWSPELSLYCAVASSGTGNRVNTSPDGITWTARTSAANHTWNSVCWSPELNIFVAVSNQVSASVMTSSNGTTWALAAGVPSINNLTSVCWSPQLGIFVAVSSTGSVITSSNGSMWTSYSGASSNAWQSICWAPELSLFVAVSNSGTGNRVMTSSNGTSWTSRTSAANYAWSSITWANDIKRFYVVTSDTNNFMMTSTDAITWTLIGTSTFNTFSSICWAPEIGKVCAVSSLTTTSNRILTHSNGVFSDGRSFSLSTANSYNILNNMNAYEWSGNLMVGVGSGTSNVIVTSSDMTSWVDRTITNSSIHSQNWTSLAWSQELGIYCAISSSGTGYRVMTSSDGNNWTPVATPADNNWTSVIWAKELSLFVAVASSGTGNRVMTSPNGTTWTLRTSAADNNWTSVAWAPSLNKLCAVGKSVSFINNISNGTNVFYIDPNYLYQTDNTTITANNNISLVNGTPGKYYTSGGYLNKPYFDFTSTTVNSMVDFIQFANNGNGMGFGTNGGFTYIGQIYISSSSPSTIVDIINMTSSSNFTTISNTNRITISYDTSTNKFNFTAYSSSTLAINQTSTNTYSMNQWYRITIAVSNVTGNLNSTMYINNVLDNTTTFTTKLGNPLLDKTTIGTSYQDISRRFVGKIDSFYVYDRLLSNSEINSMYNYIDNGEDLSMKSSDGITWNFNKNIKSATSVDNSYIYNNWTSIAWSPSLSLFCAVASTGTNNRIATSPDGITWTTRNTNYNDFAWNSVIWASEISKFYVTSSGDANDNVIATSSDGINWLLTYPPTDAAYSWKSLAWSPILGELYGVGKSSNGNISTLMSTNSMLSGNVYYPDSISANVVSPSIFSTASVAASSWRSVCWSPKLKLFCAVGAPGTTSSIRTSPDGITWTTRTAPNTNALSSVVWAPNLSRFVAVSSTTAANNTIYSSDGITWSSGTKSNNYGVDLVCYSPELSIFVATINSGVTILFTSSDGITWTARTIPSLQINSMCWSKELSKFVGIGYNTSVISSDGINWTTYTRTDNINNIYSIIWVSELSLFVAISSTGKVLTSTDGITWSINDMGTTGFRTIIYIPELSRFYAINYVTTGTSSIATSTDAVNWTTISTSITGTYYTSMTYAPEIGQLYVVSTRPTVTNYDLRFSSPVLPYYRNFTIANTTNKLGNINSVVWSPSLSEFVGIGNGTVNLIYDNFANVSGNSLVTTTTGAYLSNNWKSVAYSSSLKLYVAVASSGSGNRIMTSSNSTLWIPRISPTDNNWEKVIWASELGLFIAVASSGNSNRIMTSPNGITWTLRTTTNNNWKSIAWAPSIPLLCAVGSLLYTKPAALYNTTNNKIASIANDMTPLADGTVVTSFGSYTSVTGTAPRYYSNGGYKNKPYIQFTSTNTTTLPADLLSISSLALNISTNGGFTLVTKVYLAEGTPYSSGGIEQYRYPIWQSNNANSGGTVNNLMTLVYYSPSIVGSSQGYFQFAIFNGTSTIPICNITTSSTFALNNWYTITVTTAAANGSTSQLYVDGVLAGSATLTAAITNRTNIYNYLGQDATNISQRFLGLYDSIFVYDRLLNSTDLQTIYDYIEGTTGDNNSVMTSPDGVTWTGRSTNYDSNNITSIAWSPKLSMFVAVGNNHLGNRIIRSTNGTSWTPCKVNYDYQNWKTVVWVEDLGMFYATTTDNSYDNAILTSTDGIEWLLTYPPTDAQYSWKNFVWAKSLNKLYCFGEDVRGNAAILSHTNQIGFTTSNVTTTTPVYGNITVPQYGNVSTPVYGNVLVPQYGNVNTPVYANIITSIYGNVIIPTYSSSNSALYGNIYFPNTLNSSNITISSNIISSNYNLTLPLYGNILTPTLGNISTPIYGNITTPQYGNITTPVYGNILIPQYGVIIEPIYANVLVPVYGNVIEPIYGNVITPVYGQAYLPVYGNVLVPQYGNVLIPEYGFVQLPIYEEVTTPVYGNVIIPIYELQDFPIYETQTIPIYTAVPTPIYSNIVEDVFETVYTPIYNTSNVPIYQTVITPIYTEIITPIYGTIYLPQYEEILTPIIEERVTPIYEEILTPIYQEMIIPQTTYVYTPVYQDIIEPVYDNVLQPIYGKALLPVYTEIQIPIYSEVLVYVDPTAKTSSTNDLFTGSATVTNLLSFANGTTNNLFSTDALYAPNLTLAANPYTLNTGNMETGNITVGNLIINPNFNARNSIITDRGLTSFRNTVFSSELVVGNISVNRNYISFTSNQDFKPANISVGQSLFSTSFISNTSNVTIQNISTLNGSSMIHIKDSNSESNIRDNIINTTYLTSNNSVTAIDVNIYEGATTQNINVLNETLTSGNIYGKNFNNSSNLSAENVIATDNMFISSNVSGTFTMPRTDAGNLTIKDTVRNNNIKSSSLQDILDLYAGNISTSKLYTSIDALRSVLYKDNADNLFLGDNVVGNIYIGGPQQITQTIYIGSALDTIYIGGDLSNILSSDVNVKDAAIVINHTGTSYNNAGIQFEENSVIVGSLLLNSSGQFVFSDATGNVYSLTHIANGNFENMNVTNNVLATSHIISNNVLVQNSLTATLLNTETYQNSSNINTSNVNTTSMITNSLLSTTMTSTNMNISNNSTINGNVSISNTLQTSTFDAVDLTSSNITNTSNINGTDLSFTTLSGVNAYITNNANVENINTQEIILNAGNVTTTNSIITKNILLDSSNITTHDANYDFRINGYTHYGIESKLDTNKFGIMNITTGNTNPEPSLSLVRENNYVWNMGYDNNSNDFVIYDGNVGVRLTASNSQSWASVSDVRYKKDIVTIDEMEAMNKVMNGRGVYYNYLSDKEDAQRKVGFIAQEINEILPEVVDVPENPEELYSVRYQEVYPLLVQALKGAAKELKELKEKIKSKKM